MERVNTKFKVLETRQKQSFITYESKVHNEALHETTRLCSSIGLPQTFVQDVQKIFKGVWEKTLKHSAQRNVYAFIPVVIYRSAQLLGYSLPLKLLLPEIQVRPKRFRNVLIATYHLFGRVNHYRNIIKAIKVALEQRESYPLMLISKHGDSSQAAVTSRMFKVAVRRKLAIRKYKVHELDRLLPKHYKKLIQTTENFASPVMRDSIRNIHRIANELNMPYKVKKRAVKLLRANRRIFLMTTREVCASSAVGLAIITLGLRKKHALYHIGKVMECSSSSISARIFKVLKSRGIEGIYKISLLDKILPDRYQELLGRQ